MEGLPLIGHEEISVTWLSYAEYLSIFYGGEEALLELRRRLVGSISRGLKAILRLGRTRPGGCASGGRPNRPSSTEASLGDPLHRRAPPAVPLDRAGDPGAGRAAALPREGQPLRVAVVDPTGGAPASLSEALEGLGSSIEVAWIEEDDARNALSRRSRRDSR